MSEVTSVNAEELKGFVERYERLETEKGEIGGAQKDVLTEAEAYGYDGANIKKLVSLRKKDPEKLAESEAVLNLYREVIGV